MTAATGGVRRIVRAGVLRALPVVGSLFGIVSGPDGDLFLATSEAILGLSPFPTGGSGISPHFFHRSGGPAGESTIQQGEQIVTR